MDQPEMKISGKLRFAGAENKIIFKPDKPFGFSTAYSAFISKKVQSADKVAMPADYSWEFRSAEAAYSEAKEGVRLNKNKFSPSAGEKLTIGYSVTNGGAAKIVVYSITGRPVRKLLSGTLTAGQSFGINWDGKDDAGSVVNSGMYLIRFEVSGGPTLTKKVIVIK